MDTFRFRAIPSEQARAYQAGAPDANGQAPERRISDGGSVPCRHCLTHISAGQPYLILAYRPFPAAQPYAEVGPVFLHAEPCTRYDESEGAPAMFESWEQLLIRGYGADDRIVYGTGRVVPIAEVQSGLRAILSHPDVRYIHARSASNNCYQCRIEPV